MSAPLPRGTTVLDLVTAIPQGSYELIPSGVRRVLEHLSVVESRSRASGSFDIVEGLARSAVDIFGIDVGDGFTVEIPGATDGVPFEFTWTRIAATGNQNVEPAPTVWQLALLADRLQVPFPGRAAQRAVSTDGFVGPLVPDPDRTRSHIWVSGVWLVTNAAVNPAAGGAPFVPGPVTSSISSVPDPFAPNAPSGAIIEAGLEPRHVLFGTSGFGMTMGDVVWDQTVAFTPPAIVARGQTAAWRGISVSDATLYLPRDLPFVGDVTAGVRDLLVGFSPNDGVQLEAFLQMGEISRLDPDTDDADKVTMHLYQDVDGQISDLETPGFSLGGGADEIEVVSTNAGDPVRVMARLDPPSAIASWRLPGTGTWVTANDTGWMTVRPGDPRSTLGYRDIHTLEDGRTADGLERIYAFVSADTASDDGGFPPRVAVTLDTSDLSTAFTWDDVTKISGTREQLALMRFGAIDPLPPTADIEALTWELRHGADTLTGIGGSFDPDVSWSIGVHRLTMTDRLGRRRRLDIEVLDEAAGVLVGCSAIGPRWLIDDGLIVAEEAATPLGIVATHHLRAFHQHGEFRPAADPATIDRVEPPVLTVPDGALAEITVGLPATTHVVAAARVRMEFDAETPSSYRMIHPVDFVSDVAGYEGAHVDPWGPADPYPPSPDDPTLGGEDRVRNFAEDVEPNQAAATVLRDWAHEVLAVDSAASFVVIGRTCDIGADAYNADLAIRRAARGVTLLTSSQYAGVAVDAASVLARGETEPQITLPADPASYAGSTDPDLADRTLAGRTAEQFRIKVDYDWTTWDGDHDLAQRREARCVDIYAVVNYPTGTVVVGGDADSNAVAPSLRRTLVPGADQWAVVSEAPRERQTSYALRLLAKWDSPSWVDAADSAPTLVEAALDWQTSQLAIPVLGGSVEPAPADPDADDPRVWQVLLRYTADPRTRQMIVSGALDTPGDERGIARVVDTAPTGSSLISDLALALAVGPALMTAVSSDDVDGSVVSLGALAGVLVGSAILDVASEGEIVLQRLEFGYGHAAGGGSTDAAQRIWMYADYTAGFDVDAFGLVAGKGVVIGYQRAGIEFGNDVSTANLDDLGIVYEGPAQIVSPGTWTMSNALAKLLGVSEVRTGAGSVWIEVDLDMALDLGPIVLESATLRLTLSDPFVFELRGLALSIDIPGVLHGEGRLAITENASVGGDQLDVSAGLDLTVVPIGLGIDADFVYADPMIHLEVGVTFATPIPLLNTGLGLFGLNGRFVSNGTRDLLSATEQPDPVQRELAWLVEPTQSKYTAMAGQTALGFGATVGTTVDTGFSFNLNGMLAIEFPDPSVVLTVAGRFMSIPEGAAEDGDPATTIEASLLGIVAISGDGIAVGIRGAMEVPELLFIDIPIAAWFPFTVGGAGAVDGYVRIGSDGAGGRAGDPVTITVLPNTLDLYAWAYLMIEQKQMLLLGGKPGWDFFGFSIGFGAGYDFEWGGKAVYLRAGASIIVGVGTKPLLIKGELTAGGELRFGPVGVAIDGLIGLTLTKDDARLEGEFCGEVDLALFKAKGCVKIAVGQLGSPPVIPDPLIAGLSLTDRFARVVAMGRDMSNGGSTGVDHTAWVDARPVLHFSKRVIDGLGSSSIQPTPSSGWGADWSGSARTKFLYRLLAVEVLDENDVPVPGAVDWPSTWWMPAGRPAFPTTGDAPSSEHESWDLGLSAWDFAPWARSLVDGGTGSEGDPATMIERLCDPVPAVVPHCLYGAHGVRLAVDVVQFVETASGELPWPTTGILTAVETLGVSVASAQVWSDLLGYVTVPSGIADLPETFIHPDSGVAMTVAWALTAYVHPQLPQVTAGIVGTYSTDVDAPDLFVAVSLPIPPSGSEVDVCFEFDDLTGGLDPDDPEAPELPDVIDYGIVSITGHDRVTFTASDGWYLSFSDRIDIDVGGEFAAFTYGPANRVDAVVEYRGTEPIRMRALDADGAVLAEAVPPADVAESVPYTLSIEYPGIARVQFMGVPLDPQVDWWMSLLSICFRLQVDIDVDAYRDDLIDYFTDVATLVAPDCIGTQLGGDGPWIPELVDVLSSTERVSAVIRYTPAQAARGLWNGVRLSPSPIFDVAIVSSCFLTTSAVDAAAASSEARDEIVDGWNGLLASPDQDWIELLDADSTYRIHASYQVATWNQDDGDNGFAGPPSATTLDWLNPPASVSIAADEQTFEFATAASGSMAEEHLLRYDEQTVFDARALARYVVGFDPPDPTIPHFVDDKVLVHFAVDWIEAMVAKYDDEIRLDVVRTDPPPGTTETYADRLVESMIGWTSSTSTMHATMADATMAVAALRASCIDGPQPQGITACIDAALEPNAAYDLVVRVVPQAFPSSDGVVVTRTQFRTSKYRDADELLGSMAFHPNLAPDPFYPLEWIAEQVGPADALLGDDAALDEALADLGIDQLPLPDEPAVRIIWFDDGTDWTIVAVLLDCLEPLERPPRLEDILDDSPPGPPTITEAVVMQNRSLVAVLNGSTGVDEVVDYVEAPPRLALGAIEVGSVELTPLRSNSATTRVLYGSTVPFVPDATVMRLQWHDRGTTITAERYISSIPRLVSQEWT